MEGTDVGLSSVGFGTGAAAGAVRLVTGPLQATHASASAPFTVSQVVHVHGDRFFAWPAPSRIPTDGLAVAVRALLTERGSLQAWHRRSSSALTVSQFLHRQVSAATAAALYLVRGLTAARIPDGGKERLHLRSGYRSVHTSSEPRSSASRWCQGRGQPRG